MKARCMNVMALAMVLVLFVGAGVLVAGCSKPGGESATKPRVTEAWVTLQLTRPPDRRIELADKAGKVTLFVGADPLEFGASLSATPTDEWYAENVKVEGQTPSFSSLSATGILYQFEGGEPGDRITITLSSVVPPSGSGDSLVVTIERVAAAGVTIKVKSEGEWRDIVPGEVLAGTPLELLLAFSAPMDQASVAAALAGTSLPAGGSWLDPRDYALSLASPPAVVSIDLSTACDSNGVPLDPGSAGLVEYYTGEPARLCSLDPDVSMEQPVCRVVADVCAAATDPGGQSLLLEAYANRTGEISTWLVNLTDGSRRGLDGAYYPAWVGDGNLLSFQASGDQIDYRVAAASSGSLKWRGTLPKNFGNYSLSPDGKRLAGFVTAGEPAAPDYLVPNDLVVVDLQTGNARTFKEFVQLYNPPEGGLILGAPAWSPDGGKVAAVGDKAKGSVIRVLDLQTSLVSAEVPLPDLETGSASFFTWSPRGDFWIAGETILGTSPPYWVRDIRVQGQGEPSWSPDGVWFVRGQSFDGWGELRLFRIDAILGPVLERSLGPGFPCGWNSSGKFYFVRWPGWDSRFIPQWD